MYSRLHKLGHHFDAQCVGRAWQNVLKFYEKEVCTCNAQLYPTAVILSSQLLQGGPGRVPSKSLSRQKGGG